MKNHTIQPHANAECGVRNAVYPKHPASRIPHAALWLAMALAVGQADADECAGILCRQEIEGSDGTVGTLLRVLEDTSVRVDTTNATAFPVSFWDAGPSATALKAWHDAECSTCAAPAGYDEIDKTIDESKQFVDLSKSSKAQPIDNMARTWQEWITLLVDKRPEETDDFDDTLRILAQGDTSLTPPVKGISGWQTELIDIRDRGVAKNGLPPCAITSSAGAEVTIDNSPCTINQARKEEFNRELANTRDFLEQLSDPHSKFYHDLIINRILLPELPRRLSVYLIGADKIRNLRATIDTIDMVDGVLTYTFTSTFEFFDDYAAHDWVSGQNHGQGTVTITSLELGGSPATDGLITYTFIWSFISYDVPKPVPTIVPGPVIVNRTIVSWSSVVWTWTMEQAEFSAGMFHHHLEMPKPYSCGYSLANRCSDFDCQEGAVCIKLGDCREVKEQLTPPGVTNPPGLSDIIPVIRLDDPPVDVSCADPPIIFPASPKGLWGCPQPGSPYLLAPSVGCTLVNPHRQDIDQLVGGDGPGYSCPYGPVCAHCSGWAYQPGDVFMDLGVCLQNGFPSGSVTVSVPSGSPPNRVSVYCDTYTTSAAQCGAYLQCYTSQAGRCVRLKASGTYRIDDDQPTGTGMTISPPRTVNAPLTVQNFADGVDAFDAFVNGIPSHHSCAPAAGAICFGSRNADTADEFAPVLDDLQTLTGNIETFRAAARDFSTMMWAKYGQFGGLNPVTYSWKDSQDNHSVTVELSNFTLTKLKKRKKGNWLVGKTCMRMEDYKDDTGLNTWVKITQQDPSATIGGASPLWTWNPFGGAVCKSACVSYSFDRVGLVDCPVPHCP